MYLSCRSAERQTSYTDVHVCLQLCMGVYVCMQEVCYCAHAHMHCIATQCLKCVHLFVWPHVWECVCMCVCVHACACVCMCVWACARPVLLTSQHHALAVSSLHSGYTVTQGLPGWLSYAKPIMLQQGVDSLHAWETQCHALWFLCGGGQACKY
jgi:hypothetical protein